jgi:ABC-type nitrate/sulfonate/bicarbonate transport system ATPase subunit
MAPLAPELTLDIRRKIFAAVGNRDEILVLRDVSVAIEPRSFVVITGPSGCGKSTMLNIIAGLDRDFEGRVQFRAPDSRLAFVFQTPRLLPWRTVAENIALVFKSGDPRIAQIPEMLTRVGLSGAEHAYPERLSLGMQRRVALARAFILEPDILLMDEPFVSLDDPTALSLRRLLIELWTRRPTTVLFVTHDRFEAVMLGTRILRLSGGSATVAQDAAVTLSPGDRLCPEKVRAEQRRIFGDT